LPKRGRPRSRESDRVSGIPTQEVRSMSIAKLAVVTMSAASEAAL
jgi:hypothetical protein